MCAMKRKLYSEMLDWKAKWAGQYSLMIEGARRVGKSYIVEEFVRQEYAHSLIIDFASADKTVKQLFQDKLHNLDEFFMLLETHLGVHLVRGESVIVFDEVQRFPRAREAIKYLVKDGRYQYIETGSLVSLKKNVDKILIPSEEMKLKLHPMDFEEFLWAMGEEMLMEIVRDHFQRGEPMGPILHRKAMDLFRQYLVVGGMPQAVEAFVNGRDLVAVEKAKRAILDLYQDDIGKFSGRLRHKTLAIWNGIPGALSAHEKRFRPSDVGTGLRMRELDSPFEWLKESMTVNVAYNATDPNTGFKMSEDRSALKCYMADTGLLISHAFSENQAALADIVKAILFGKLEVNKGMIIENAVAQMFRAAGQELYFHFNDDRKNALNKMEIDFVLTKSKVSSAHNVYPIEVKSNKEYSTTSLERFRTKFKRYVATPIVLHPKDLATKNGIRYLPLYMAPLVTEFD